MPVRELSSATWEEVAALGRATDAGSAPSGRVVAILPVGATEAHGPHLPLSTDVIIAQAMARAGAERLAERGRDVLILPPLAYTAAPFAAGFPGTISLRPETATALVVDIGRSLSARGVGLLAIANAHLDPAHLESLRAAVVALAGVDDTLLVAFPDITRRRLAARLTEEFRSGATHAGRFESSIVMAERPEWVHEAIRADLPPVPYSLSDAIRAGRCTFEEAGGPRAYFGWPADATAEEGRRSIAVLGEVLEEAVLEAEATAEGAGEGAGTGEADGGVTTDREEDRR